MAFPLIPLAFAAGAGIIGSQVAPKQGVKDSPEKIEIQKSIDRIMLSPDWLSWRQTVNYFSDSDFKNAVMAEVDKYSGVIRTLPTSAFNFPGLAKWVKSEKNIIQTSINTMLTPGNGNFNLWKDSPWHDPNQAIKDIWNTAHTYNPSVPKTLNENQFNYPNLQAVVKTSGEAWNEFIKNVQSYSGAGAAIGGGITGALTGGLGAAAGGAIGALAGAGTAVITSVGDWFDWF
jgi:hypothetical protein